jgi:acyl-CoA-binding protein
MSNDDRFQQALQRVKSLPNQPPNVLLDLYGLYKQATDGDVQGKRPGILDVRGRAKWDAWEKRKGTSPDKARADYADYVDKLAK